jgi:CRP/FNR family transcriptional regulator
MEINREIIQKKLNQLFPELAIDTKLVDLIASDGKFLELEKGNTLIETGKNIQYIPLVIHGTLKVFKENEEGEELYLYHIGKGDVCVASIHCYHQANYSKIKAQAEEWTEIFAVPASLMPQLMKNYPAWFKFVVDSWQDKFEELLDTIDHIAFKQLDARLLQYLKKHQEAINDDTLIITHAQIASELGSKREVISRLLKKMEAEGIVSLGRNKITLVAKL